MYPISHHVVFEMLKPAAQAHLTLSALISLEMEVGRGKRLNPALACNEPSPQHPVIKVFLCE